MPLQDSCFRLPLQCWQRYQFIVLSYAWQTAAFARCCTVGKRKPDFCLYLITGAFALYCETARCFGATAFAAGLRIVCYLTVPQTWSLDLSHASKFVRAFARCRDFGRKFVQAGLVPHNSCFHILLRLLAKDLFCCASSARNTTASTPQRRSWCSRTARARSQLPRRSRSALLSWYVAPSAAPHGVVSSRIRLPSRCPILVTCGARASPLEAEEDGRYA